MYHTYHHIPRSGWKKGDTLNMNLSVNDSVGGFYHLDFLVRNQTDYPYQELLLSVNHNFPDTASWSTDTLLFHIADEKGNWLGKGISGLYETVIALDSASISSQKYIFCIIPITEDAALTGINDIGIVARKITK